MTGYAHPEVLVTTQWVADHLSDPQLRVVESDEDVLLYTQGHVPGAVMIDWHTDLQDADRPRLHRQRSLRRVVLLQRHRQRHHRRLLRRQKQLVGLLRLLGLQTVRPRKMPGHERRPQALGSRRPPMVARSGAQISPHFVHRQRSRSVHPRFPRRGAQAHPRRQAAGRRAIAGRIHRRIDRHARLSAGRCPARRPHSRRREHSLVEGCQRRRHIQIRQGTGKAVLQGTPSFAPWPHRRLLPHRRTLQPHLVRAAIPVGFPK